jgi:hypothetical protein
MFFDSAETETDPIEQNRLYRHAMRSHINALRVLRRETKAEVNAARRQYNEVLETSVESLKKSNEAMIFRMDSAD